ncbi:DegQ family serine endoprotease [uncultured Paludibaculum sp.]|uniref:DegQ family serine endoprotease n=1 Tax=uncultured Paludibaculum sp. TaxID=1765020 RepID=UPI002AABBCCB|nr:DegQ family serine endoprotease [uncultured Paludibaculum sp.]
MMKNWKNRTGLAVVFASALVLGGLGTAYASKVLASSNPPATLKLADANEGPSRLSFAPIVKRAYPTVVNISSSKVVRTPTSMSGAMPMDPFFEQFFGRGFGGRAIPKERREQSLGSGVIVSPEGYIITNNHVVDGATDVKVMLSDKRELKARVVGTDAKTDVAVLKVDAGSLPYITIADSAKVQVGDFALAIGNPFGVGQTVTMGIVSATGRGNLGIEDYEDFIQTDAPINPGNSGGALVNERGELVGINTAILSHGSGGNQGIGFAIPSNLVRQVMDSILKDGKVTRAYLGIVPQDVTPAMMQAFNVKDSRGALVGDVTADGPAAKSGLQKGDIITEVNGAPIDDSNQLRNRISMMPVDSQAKLKVLRDGVEKSITVTLGALPTREERASNDKPGGDSNLNGIQVENLTANAARELGISPNTQGVVVSDVDPDSPAADSGLRPGDIIQEVNRQPVRNVADFNRAVQKSGKNPLLLVNRGGNTLYVAV